MEDLTSEEIQTWIMSKATDSDLKLLQDIIGVKLRISFKVGDKVWFDAKTRGIIKGTISKMNHKTAKVRTDVGLQWTVTPALLHKDT